MQPELIGEFLETGIITPARMRVVDTNAMALGVTELQLMESAGRALADMARTSARTGCWSSAVKVTMVVTGWWQPVISSVESRQMSATLTPGRRVGPASTSSQC